MKKSLVRGFIAAIILLSQSTYATHSCFLPIQITNLTNSPCQLESSKLVHGYLLSSIPITIFPGQVGEFKIHRFLYGPDIILKYQCGDKSVEFESQSDRGWAFIAAKINAVIIHTDVGIHIEPKIYEDNTIWSPIDMINWTISN